MFEFRNLHQPGCPHAGTSDGWTVYETSLPDRRSDPDGDVPRRVRQTLACTACGIAYVRTFAIEGASITTPQALALGWPVQRVAGCELVVIRVSTLWADPKPEVWQVHRDGRALGLIATGRGPRGGTHYTAGLYPPDTAPFHPEYTAYRDQAHPTGAGQQCNSLTGAVRWVRDHAPSPTVNSGDDSPAETR